MKQVKAIALCHNVTPVVEEETSTENNTNGDGHIELSDSVTDSGINYQAASPDEVALVQWTESVGLTLVNRDLTEIHLRSPMGDIMKFTVLRVFPFTSETKRMGIIVREEKSGEITFYMKGKETLGLRCIVDLILRQQNFESFIIRTERLKALVMVIPLRLRWII